jgi:hypothetical protein
VDRNGEDEEPDPIDGCRGGALAPLHEVLVGNELVDGGDGDGAEDNTRDRGGGGR